MKKALESYTYLCALAGRKPDALEFLAMTHLRIIPEWIEKL